LGDSDHPWRPGDKTRQSVWPLAWPGIPSEKTVALGGAGPMLLRDAARPPREAPRRPPAWTS